MKQNYSKKREAILSVLKSTNTHPTADWIYTRLKPEISDLSLGTVYRNLANFKKNNTIRSVGIVDGHERFDGDTAPHSHFICIECNNVIDIDESFISKSHIGKIEKDFNVQIIDHNINFYGKCNECLK